MYRLGGNKSFVGIKVKGLVLENDISAIELATELTVAWLANPNTRVSMDDVPAFLMRMVETVHALGENKSEPEPEAKSEYMPATTVRKSLASPDHIISMIDGKPYKTLRRHLSTNGMTPEEYRQRYNLKSDYPMVAPSYSAARQEMAKKIGLGRKSGQTNAAKVPPKNAREAAKDHLSGE